MTEENEVGAAGPDEDVVVVDETPAAEPARAEAPRRKPVVDGLDPEDADYGTKVQKRIGQLAKQRREAEAAAARERARAEAAERALYEVRKNSLTATDAALTRDFDHAKARHQRAFSEGDAEAVAQTSAEMAELAARRAEVQRAAREPAPQQAAPAQRFTPKTQEYIDQNPWFETDPDAQATAVTAHAAAVRRGIRADTPEYFDFVTKRVKAVHPEHFQDDDEEEEIEQPRRSPAPPVAPARRTVPGMGAPKGKLPSLTAAEADFARSAGIDLKDYAQQKARLAAAGELGIRK